MMEKWLEWSAYVDGGWVIGEFGESFTTCTERSFLVPGKTSKVPPCWPPPDHTTPFTSKRAINKQKYYYASYLLYTASSAKISHNVELPATVFRPALLRTFTSYFPK